MIAIIDYGMGNVRSLHNAIEYIGCDVKISADPHILRDADKLILPGVGAFGDAMHAMQERGLDDILNREVIEKGKPLLGICLGLQLLAHSSTEHGFHKGLGWLDATVVGFDPDSGVKIPHMGWNDICYEAPEPLFTGLTPDEKVFYFVHSFYISCKDTADILATCTHGIEFTAAIRHNNIIATQFHPEKSQDNGIQVLKNFVQWNP
jgi:glutamine amidotransferase